MVGKKPGRRFDSHVQARIESSRLGAFLKPICDRLPSRSIPTSDRQDSDARTVAGVQPSPVGPPVHG